MTFTEPRTLEELQAFTRMVMPIPLVLTPEQLERLRGMFRGTL